MYLYAIETDTATTIQAANRTELVVLHTGVRAGIPRLPRKCLSDRSCGQALCHACVLMANIKLQAYLEAHRDFTGCSIGLV